MGRDSVASLNQEIVKRCTDFRNQIIAWRLHLHPQKDIPSLFRFGGLRALTQQQYVMPAGSVH